jgi:DoxX-like family
MSSHGVYVEIAIASDVETVWRLTQQPDLHQRWDLRFSTISYLPRNPGEPQRFFYETRIGFGMAIAGEGESTGERNTADETTSALRFWSADKRSLIREGSGYWKYIHTGDAVRFFTWYDYQTRFGGPGSITDRIVFRPLMGWATAWSFDRLRLWIEHALPPEQVLRSTLIYTLTRLTICAIWIWHGAIPKLLFPQQDELHLLAAQGLSPHLLPLTGALEIAFGLIGLFAWQWRGYLLATILLMLLAFAGVALSSPSFLTHAFGPVTLNAAVVALSLTGLLAAPSTAFAGRCLRRPKERS